MISTVFTVNFVGRSDIVAVIPNSVRHNLIENREWSQSIVCVRHFLVGIL